MEIKHHLANSFGVFYIEDNGQQIAEMSYMLAGDHTTMIVEHTEVAKELQGEHVGAQLVAAGVEYARMRHYSILPLCPFAKMILERNSSFHDVLVH